MSFEQDIIGKLPLAAASAFFLKLKTAAEPFAPPDETGALEGQFAVPTEQVLALMTQMVENEFKTMLAYRVYAETLRGLEHFAIEREFEEHAENELKHAEWLLRRMAVLGGPVQLGDIPAPPASSEPLDIIQTMVRMEQEGIEHWRALLAVMGDNPSKHTIEEFLTTEQEHLDELWQMLPHTANTPVLQPPSTVTASAAPPQPAGATPPTNTKDETGFSPPAATEMEKKQSSVTTEKVASMKMAAEHQRILRKRASGNFDVPGAATRIMEDMLKTGAAKMREKVAGIGGSYDWKPMAAIPGTAADPEATGATPQAIQVTLPAIGSYPGKTQGGDAVIPSAKPRGGGGGSSDEMGMGDMGLGKEGSSKEHVEKGRHRAESNLAARGRQTEGMRGELYGDVIGRLLGAGGGFFAGHKGGALPAMAGAALGQHLGGKTGKTLGREADAHGAKKLGSIKKAFEDTMNVMGQEQMLMEAQSKNEGEFYRSRAQQAQAAQQEMERSLQAAQQSSEEQKAQLAALQQQVEQQTQMSSDATTKALMQTVQANNAALQSRQVANESSASLQKLKQTLMEIASDNGGGANTGGMGAGGEPATSPEQQGPAGQAAGAGSAPSAAPPEGATTMQAPMESPDSGANGSPTHISGQADMNRPSTGQKSASAVMEGLTQAAKQHAHRLPYAVGGALLGGGAQAASNAMGSEGLRGKVQASEAAGPPGSFREAMTLAKQKAQLGFSEAGEAHPVASTAIAALGGAAMGAGAGPGLVGKLKQAPGDISTLLGD